MSVKMAVIHFLSPPQLELAGIGHDLVDDRA
jgi:hypothetical protein